MLSFLGAYMRRTGQRFLDIEMPEVFELETPSESGEWIVWGGYQARTFDRLEDGTYVCAGHGGSPLFLRCLRQRGNLIDVIDGTGQHFLYRLTAVPHA